jgi:hypothetical protein
MNVVRELLADKRKLEQIKHICDLETLFTGKQIPLVRRIMVVLNSSPSVLPGSDNSQNTKQG